MDRFKFRAWYKNNYIYDVEEATDNSEYPTGDIMDYFSSFSDVVGCEDCVVEQCTGLKDKNGKLIYEGDIILVEDNKCPIEWESENARYNVVGYGELAYLNYNDIEVIGNIHENIDLLEI